MTASDFLNNAVTFACYQTTKNDHDARALPKMVTLFLAPTPAASYYQHEINVARLDLLKLLLGREPLRSDLRNEYAALRRFEAQCPREETQAPDHDQAVQGRSVCRLAMVSDPFAAPKRSRSFGSLMRQAAQANDDVFVLGLLQLAHGARHARRRMCAGRRRRSDVSRRRHRRTHFVNYSDGTSGDGGRRDLAWPRAAHLVRMSAARGGLMTSGALVWSMRCC